MTLEVFKQKYLKRLHIQRVELIKKKNSKGWSNSLFHRPKKEVCMSVQQVLVLGTYVSIMGIIAI